MNGQCINAPHVDCVMTTRALAASAIDEAAFAAGLRCHLQAR